MKTVNDHANDIAAGLSSSPQMVGMDPITIITLVTTLLPALLKCLKPDTPEAVAKAVSSKWSAAGGYRKPFLDRVATEVMKTAKKQGQKLTKAQAREIAVATLDDARQAKTSEVKAFGASVGAWS